VFKIPRSRPWPPALDLATVRETLHYMTDDIRRIPGLEKATAALDAALVEIRAAEEKSKPISYETKFSRFLPSKH
jgi:hypothetical protein